MGKCEPKLVNNTYVASCVCDEGYHGEKCEKGNDIKLEKLFLTRYLITLWIIYYFCSYILKFDLC